MNNHPHLSRIVSAALIFILGTAGFLASGKTPYDVKYNTKRLEDITEEVLKQVAVQRKLFDAKLAEYAKQGNGNNPNGGYGDPMMMGPNAGGPGMPGTPGAQPAKPAMEKPVYKLDANLIKMAIKKKFPARIEDSLGPMPLVDTRSKMDLLDAYKNEVTRQFEGEREERAAKERKDAEELYPLYKEGTTVEIRYSIGHENPRYYKGVFKRVGRFQITIGRHNLRFADLPEMIQARFDKKLNEEAKRKYIAKHPLLNKLETDIETALAERVKQELEKQFIRNLPRGWVYVSDSWRMPEDLVDEILAFRKDKVRAEEEMRKAARLRASQQTYISKP